MDKCIKAQSTLDDFVLFGFCLFFFSLSCRCEEYRDLY